MGSGASALFEEKPALFGILLHVYSLTAEQSLGRLFGDLTGMHALHTGVEVFDAALEEGTNQVKVKKRGVELAYGAGGGVWTQRPRKAPQFQGQIVEYKESIFICTFTKKRSEVRECVREARLAFLGCHYDLLSKNCNHFSDYLISNLTNGQHHLPRNINSLANTASKAAAAIGGVLRVGLEVTDHLEARSGDSTGLQGRVEELT
jgi:hypothetical protein